MSESAAGRSSRRAASPLLLIVVGSLLGVAILPLGSTRARGDAAPDHLVISEIVTGGASASDEFIELYNPAPQALPLEGLELVYVTASGLTVSRRAAWAGGAPVVPPGHHVLVAHELGIYAAIADAVYASGMGATGGSVAIRIQGAASAVDAVGWGTAASAWLEGRPAPAPAAGSSLERRPGGLLGSTQDTGDNLADFVERLLPDPQNTASPPTPDPDPSSPSPTESPAPSATPAVTPEPTPSGPPGPNPSPSPGLTVVPVAIARALPDGTGVTVEGTTLTDSAFGDGGGYLADATGGIAVLLSSGAYERGMRLRVSGTVDNRFSQRTIRASLAQVTSLGTGLEPDPMSRATGEIGEAVEGSLVRIAGLISGSPTTLSAGLAYDVNDGSGATRVLVGSGTGIDTGAWSSGSLVDLVGVVGQRDSSGTGTAGYRVQPRSASDVIHVGMPSTSPAPSPGGPPDGGTPSPGPSGLPEGVVTIAKARSAPKNDRLRVRGTVTLPSGLVHPGSAVIQDATGAILLRVGDDVGPLARGERVEVEGVRSTLAGMETLRVTRPAVRLGSGPEPAPTALRTGDAGEALEARLVLVRGSLVASARRVASGTVSFEIDDGSGPLRVYVAASLAADPSDLRAGAWVEATGVLGQDTTGAQPLRGYRVWPRSADEVRVGAAPTDAAAGSATGDGESDAAAGSTAAPPASLAGVGGPDLASLRIGATLVARPWPELGVGGLLWDGTRVVAIDASSADAVAELLAGGPPPLSLELGGLRATGVDPTTGVPLVALGADPSDRARGSGAPVVPLARLVDHGAPRWVSVIGRLSGSRAEPHLRVGALEARIDMRCESGIATPSGPVSVTGIGLAGPTRILVPCDGLRPAPALGRAEPPSTSRLTSSPLAAAAVAPAAPRGPAAGLLAAAGLLLGGTAVARWRRGADRAPDPEEGAGATDGDDGTRPDAQASLRPLSLVSVPHERGSP